MSPGAADGSRGSDCCRIAAGGTARCEQGGLPGTVGVEVGPGIGRSVGLRFAREGLPVALVARHGAKARAVHVVGAITAAAHTLPGTAARGHGTFLVTGGLPAPAPVTVSLPLGQAGVRALAALLDERYGPSGVRIAAVTVAGEVVPGTATDPDRIAEQHWRLHDQPPAAWNPRCSSRPAARIRSCGE